MGNALLGQTVTTYHEATKACAATSLTTSEFRLRCQSAKPSASSARDAAFFGLMADVDSSTKCPVCKEPLVAPSSRLFALRRLSSSRAPLPAKKTANTKAARKPTVRETRQAALRVKREHKHLSLKRGRCALCDRTLVNIPSFLSRFDKELTAAARWPKKTSSPKKKFVGFKRVASEEHRLPSSPMRRLRLRSG